MKPFWTRVAEESLAQGDLLPCCLVPIFEPNFGSAAEAEVPVKESNLIVVTQTCDLVNDKVLLVALCPIFSLEEFEETNPKFKSKGQWEEVRKGRVEGLHMLGPRENLQDNRASLVVDFGVIYSLPPGYLKTRAIETGTRWRLESPFLEHFSQAFARYFMRVGLPSSIPAFK